MPLIGTFIDRRDWANDDERQNFRAWMKKKKFTISMLVNLLGDGFNYQTVQKKISGHGAHITKTEIQNWKKIIGKKDPAN